MRAIATAVIAKDAANGISYKGNIPWPQLRQSADLIENRTKDNVVIMGRKTWESIPKGSKPYAGRLNYIISKKLTTLAIAREYGTGVVVFASLEEAMLSALAHNSDKKIFIIGGGEIFKEAIAKNLVSTIILTDIQNKFEADTFFKFPTNFEKLESTDMISQEIPGTATKNSPNEQIKYMITVFRVYQNAEEVEYLKLLASIIQAGIKGKINEFDVLKIFGTQLTFNLENSFPRFTTRKVPVKGVFLETLWQLRGDTNIDFLRENKIYTNDKYATKEFHEKNAFDYKPGEIGHCEGYQWRNFGGDQLAQVVSQIKERTGENVIISWNPVDYPKMAIKPKTLAIQFDVSTRLDCRVILNSVDMISQFPMMVAGYSFLALLMSKMTKVQPGRITFQVGTSYIREAHISCAEYEIERTPYPFPLVGIRRDLSVEDLNTFDIDEDIVWENYVYHEGLTYPTSNVSTNSATTKNPMLETSSKTEELPESLKKKDIMPMPHNHSHDTPKKDSSAKNVKGKQTKPVSSSSSSASSSNSANSVKKDTPKTDVKPAKEPEKPKEQEKPKESERSSKQNDDDDDLLIPSSL
jgi:dihydrofolate reductase/thymidylate synthase